VDAFVREMHLGLGCAIENMLVAAGPNGYDAEVAGVEGSLANFTERRSPVAAASVRLKKRARSAPDGLYNAIALRHTNRYAYERSKAVPADWREFRFWCEAWVWRIFGGKLARDEPGQAC
jgi:hypothetical protein